MEEKKVINEEELEAVSGALSQEEIERLIEERKKKIEKAKKVLAD